MPVVASSSLASPLTTATQGEAAARVVGGDWVGRKLRRGWRTASNHRRKTPKTRTRGPRDAGKLRKPFAPSGPTMAALANEHLFLPVPAPPVSSEAMKNWGKEEMKYGSGGHRRKNRSRAAEKRRRDNTHRPDLLLIPTSSPPPESWGQVPRSVRWRARPDKDGSRATPFPLLIAQMFERALRPYNIHGRTTSRRGLEGGSPSNQPPQGLAPRFIAKMAEPSRPPRNEREHLRAAVPLY